MPLETPPWRVKNPCRTPSIEARLDALNFILSGVTMAGAQSEATKCLRREASGQARLIAEEAF
jgi:hypothetical protein